MLCGMTQDTPIQNPSAGSREGRDGHVALVGAGPGSADLLTLRALRLLRAADIVFHDALVPAEVLEMAGAQARIVSVGKRKGCHSKRQDEIDRMLVEAGRAGLRVVRLKAGDPMVFGRAGEEIAALRRAGISHEVVPGITAATAAAADLALPLTLRGTASTLVFTTGHDMKGDVLPDWARVAAQGITVAVYMGRTVAAEVAERLGAAGLPMETPVAAVENAGRPEARALVGTLKDLPVLAARDDLTGPTLVVIGEAVAAADLTRTEPLRARAPAERALEEFCA